MCKEITEVLEAEEKTDHIVVDQIKEKFGSLRFYYHFEGMEPGIQAFDFIGQGSIRIMPGRVMHIKKFLKLYKNMKTSRRRYVKSAAVRGL